MKKNPSTWWIKYCIASLEHWRSGWDKNARASLTHGKYWNQWNYIKRRDEFAPSIPTFHCHILIPRQNVINHAQNREMWHPCQRTQVPELLQALEFLQKNWWAEVAAARNLKGFKSSRSVSQVARQCREISAEFSGKSVRGKWCHLFAILIQWINRSLAKCS